MGEAVLWLQDAPEALLVSEGEARARDGKILSGELGCGKSVTTSPFGPFRVQSHGCGVWGQRDGLEARARRRAVEVLLAAKAHTAPMTLSTTTDLRGRSTGARPEAGRGGIGLRLKPLRWRQRSEARCEWPPALHPPGRHGLKAAR